MVKNPVSVTVTGATGDIGCALLFRVASGAMLGTDQPVRIKMLEILPALKAAEGTAMELNDCAFPLLTGIDVTDDAGVAFEDRDFGLLVDSMPRKKGMERTDLISANSGIFGSQDKAINDHATDDVRILVVSDPANTNTVIAAASAPDVPADRFNAIMCLDHNRAISQLAEKTGAAVADIKKMIVWGNHSADQYPDVSFREVAGKAVTGLVSEAWSDEYFVPTVAKRGAAIIEAYGASSAVSAASVVIDHMRSWALGTPAGDWVTTAVPSHDEYGVPEGLSYGFPAISDGKAWKIVEGLELSAKIKEEIAFNAARATGEIDAVKSLGIL